MVKLLILIIFFSSVLDSLAITPPYQFTNAKGTAIVGRIKLETLKIDNDKISAKIYWNTKSKLAMDGIFSVFGEFTANCTNKTLVGNNIITKDSSEIIRQYEKEMVFDLAYYEIVRNTYHYLCTGDALKMKQYTEKIKIPNATKNATKEVK